MKKFSEEDVEKMTKFINMINEKMTFNAGLKLTEIPSIYAQLAWIQSTVIPTMEANIMEVLQEETRLANQESKSDD